MNKIKSFEQYLMDSCWEAEGILDDDMPDAFNAWLADLDIDEIMVYAEQWGEYIQMVLAQHYDKMKYNE